MYCVLHFFSGQRRPGDYRDWLDLALAVSHYVRTLSGPLAWMWPSVPSFVIYLAVEGLPAGSTLPSPAVLSWSLGGHRARRGVSPVGMVAPGPLVVCTAWPLAHSHLVPCSCLCVRPCRCHGAPTAAQLVAAGPVLAEAARVDVTCPCWRHRVCTP